MYDLYNEYNDDILTVTELCELLKIGLNKGYELVKSGEIKSFKIGNSYRIQKCAITDYIIKNQSLGSIK